MTCQCGHSKDDHVELQDGGRGSCNICIGIPRPSRCMFYRSQIRPQEMPRSTLEKVSKAIENGTLMKTSVDVDEHARHLLDYVKTTTVTFTIVEQREVFAVDTIVCCHFNHPQFRNRVAIVKGVHFNPPQRDAFDITDMTGDQWSHTLPKRGKVGCYDLLFNDGTRISVLPHLVEKCP